MDASQIHAHWTQWATQYGADVRATTRAQTPKILELEALTRSLREILGSKKTADVLELGCGNGVNCLALARAFPNLRIDGVDFVREMVDAARAQASQESLESVRFFLGDVLDLDGAKGIKDEYDVVFTDRCLINLNTLDLQKGAISALIARMKPGGHLLLIENSLTTYARQNRCREILGLPARTPASFNLFFDEESIRAHVAASGLGLVKVEDFSSLHDLLLYVLLPALNGGQLEYDHPLVKLATILSAGVSSVSPGAFGEFGQNRLFHWKRPVIAAANT